MNVFWFRRDLRLEDNHGLYEALRNGKSVLPLFIFDKEILKKLPADDARVNFIHRRLKHLDQQIRAAGGGGLTVEAGSPLGVFKKLLKTKSIDGIYCNEDYEPYAIHRDAQIAKLIGPSKFYSFKDQVIFSRSEIVKENGDPYRVFTAYAKRWRATLKPSLLKPYPSGKRIGGLSTEPVGPFVALRGFNFDPNLLSVIDFKINQSTLRNYQKMRDRLDLEGTSRVGIHLRFGTVSIRQLVRSIGVVSPTFLNELIWREFFMQMLFHFPKTVSEPFDIRYSSLKWRNKSTEFNRWCNGQTGIPIVDAGMRELNKTGFMHNRARMIVGSFLCKHLLIDWRWGERYFAEKLLDFELASNVGNWQWVAGCGCDAAPYFRVFNPMLQAKKFDPKGEYVRKWVPEFKSNVYPEPIVDLEFGRRRALLTYRKCLRSGEV